MIKNKHKIWWIFLLIALVIIIGISLYKTYKGVNIKTGPGVGCYYIFKTPHDYKDLVVIQLDNNDGYKAIYKNIFAQAKELDDGYTLHASYDCYPDFIDDHFFVNISSDGYDQIDWSNDSETLMNNMKNLLVRDSFEEAYYCLDFADTVAISAINDLISKDQLLAICQKKK
jgi:hypothetical protein